MGWPLLVLAYGRAFEPSYFVMLAALPGVVGYGVLQVYTNHMRIVAEASIVAIPSAIGAMVMLIGLVDRHAPLGHNRGGDRLLGGRRWPRSLRLTRSAYERPIPPSIDRGQLSPKQFSRSFRCRRDRELGRNASQTVKDLFVGAIPPKVVRQLRPCCLR